MTLEEFFTHLQNNPDHRGLIVQQHMTIGALANTIKANTAAKSTNKQWLIAVGQPPATVEKFNVIVKV